MLTKPWKKILPTFLWQLFLVIMCSINFVMAAPVNDSCSKAVIITIPGNGFGLGTFTSTTDDISKATIQAGETFAPAILVAGLNEKSIWYKFSLPTTRSVSVTLAQPPDNQITAGDAGFTVYKASSCLPGNADISTKLTPIATFGNTFHPCVDPGDYLIQVTANSKANGLLYIQLDISDATGASFDHPKDAYDFGTLTNFTSHVDFNVDCQSIEDESEVCNTLSDYKNYTKSTWHTFTTPAYFDYIGLLLAGSNCSFTKGQSTIGFRLYKGDAKITSIPSLVPVTACDSMVSGGYFPASKIFTCSQLNPNTTYSVQLFYKYDFYEAVRVAISYLGTAPTQAPEPVLSKIPASNQLGTLPSDGYGVTTYASDYLACNSHVYAHSCGDALPDSGIVYNGYRYNLSTFFTFSLASSTNLKFNLSSQYCGSYPFLFRLYSKNVSSSCSDLTNNDLLLQGQDNGSITCLQPGTYTVQVMGIDSVLPYNYLYCGTLANSSQLCLLSNLGDQINLSITAIAVKGANLFSLNKDKAYDAINGSGGAMQPLQNGIIYQSVSDTLGCSNGVLPAGDKCNPAADKAIYREFVIGDANGDNKADSGIVTISNFWYYNPYHYLQYKLYKGDANALAGTQNAHNYPDTINGLTAFSECRVSPSCYGDKFCVVPGTYTWVTIGDDNHVGAIDQPNFQFDAIVTNHYNGATAQDMGSILDTVQLKGNYQLFTDIDYFSCKDNAITIDGFTPPDMGYGHPATKAIYRQFYLSAPAIVDVCNNYYYNCDYSIRNFAIFTGKASDGLDKLKFFASLNSCWTTPRCSPLSPGWYSLVSYGDGPTYSDPFQHINEGYSGSDIGRKNQLYLTVTIACLPPKYNRPYKACVDTTTGKPFVTDWADATGSTPAYPVTDITYTLYTENFNCSLDTPFASHPVTSCNSALNRVAYYVFSITKESYVQINTQGLWGEVFAKDVRKDSSQFTSITPVQPCLQSNGYIELCRLQPGTYTLVIFAGDNNVNGCGSVTPTIYVDKTGYSRFDHAAQAYDFGTVPADSAYHNGKTGDVNPLNAGRAPSNDFFYCTTGSRETDPTETACAVVYNPKIYASGTNVHLYDSSNIPDYYSISRRNLWYTFVIDRPGYVHVKVSNKTSDKTYQYPFAVYKSDVDGSLPFSSVVGSGLVDSTNDQGLTLMVNNLQYYYYYCQGPDEISFYRDPCTFSTPERYYIVVDNRNPYGYTDPHAMNPNSQVEVSVLIDSTNAIGTKFDHYYQAYNIGNNVGKGIYTGASDNFSCATADVTDPNQGYQCAQKTLWYKFTTNITGHVRFISKVNGTAIDYGADIFLYRETLPGDSTANGLQYEPAAYVYDDSSGHYWGEHCISPGTYYLFVTGCYRLNEDFEPVIRLDEEAGDFCSAPVVAPLNGPGTNVSSLTMDCHTIGTDYGEFGPALTCPIGAMTSGYKSSWYRIDITGKDTLDVTVYLVENTNADAADIQYRLMTGDCGAMQEQSCVQDALTQNTYQCLKFGSYYLQLFTPLTKNGYQVTGNIDLHLSAAIHTDTCAPINNCLATANFIPQFDCTTDDSVKFVNYSTYGMSIKYTWDFGYNGKKSSAVSPSFFYPALANDMTYQVKLVTENTKCSGADSVVVPVTIPGRPYVNFGPDLNLCNSDTSVTLNATSFPGSVYQWQDYSSGPQYIVSNKGNNLYSVQVTYNNCISTDTINIDINPIQKSPPKNFTICLEDSVLLSDYQNYSGISYQWSTGESDYYVYAKNSGDYWVDINYNGCITRDSFTVASVSDLHPLGTDTSTCFSQSSYTLNAYVDGAGYYQWQDGSGGTQYTAYSPGIYWCDITVGNCTVRDSITLTDAQPTVPSITGNMQYCAGDSTLLSAGNGFNRYNWNNGDTSQMIYVHTPGTYHVTVFNKQGCSAVSPDVQVIENNNPIPVISGNTFACYNDSVLLDAGPAYNAYAWSNGDTTQRVSLKSPGKVLVMVTDQNGCKGMDSVTVSIDKAASSVSQNSMICYGENYSLPSGKIITAPGIYTDTLKSSKGCDSLITTLNLAVNPAPLLVKTDAIICNGESYTMPSGNTVNQTGVYNDSIKNNLGCDSIITTVTLTVSPSAATSNITGIICERQTYKLPSGREVSVAGFYSDTLYTQSGCDSLITNLNLAVQSSKYQDVTAHVCFGQPYVLPSGNSVTKTGTYADTIHTIAGCDSLISNVSLTVGMQPQENNIVANICAGRVFTLPSGKVVNTTGVYRDVIADKYACDSIVTNVNLTVTSLAKLVNIPAIFCAGQTYTLPWNIIVNEPGIYNDTLRSLAGCDSIITSVSLTQKALPVFGVSPTSTKICVGDSIRLTAYGGDGYHWYPENEVSSPANASTWVKPGAQITYSVAITDLDCNVSDTLFSTVSIIPKPIITASSSNDVDCLIGISKLSARGGIKYTWLPPTGLNYTSINNPTASPSETTMYHVFGTSTSGCIGEDSVKVKVIKGYLENGNAVASAFTPNSDGKNDCFGLRSWGAATNVNFSIYDRWGRLLFHTTNIGDCWDGKYKGELMPAGAYVYQASAETLCGRVFRKGTVVLIR